MPPLPPDEQMTLDLGDLPTTPPCPRRRRPPAEVLIGAVVVPFPSSQHIRVRRLAARLRRAPDAAAREKIWRGAIRRLRAERLAAGLLPDAVKVDLVDFASAVRAAYRTPPRPARGGRR